MSALARPLALRGGVTLPNRIMKSAMSESLAGTDGLPLQAHATLYERLARGGSGLLVIAAAADNAWYQTQLHRMAQGDEPLPTLGALAGLRRAAGTFWRARRR